MTIYCGDVLDMLKTLPPFSIDAIIVDPPGAIHFMGKAWDTDKGGRDLWVNWMTKVFWNARKVIKPGGHMLVWSIPRTSHWTALAIEQAGWEIRDTIDHIFGSGYPKSLNIGKQFDKSAGAHRNVTGTYRVTGNALTPLHLKGGTYRVGAPNAPGGDLAITEPATDDAKQYDGWGTGLKPSHETWWLCRSPIAAGTITKNTKFFQTGGLNIDAARINGPDKQAYNVGHLKSGDVYAQDAYTKTSLQQTEDTRPGSRFPSNTVFSHSPNCIPLGTKHVKGDGHKTTKGPTSRKGTSIFGMGKPGVTTSRLNGSDGNETIAAWECSDDCPIKQLDEQAGNRKSGGGIKSKAGHSIGMLQGEDAYHFQHDGDYQEPSDGTASRFFTCLPAFMYQPKPSSRERNLGLDAIPDGSVHRYGAGIGEGFTPDAPVTEKNTHPTVKSVELMRYFIRLIVPEGGTCLDFFMGSGSTGVACALEGVSFIGIDNDTTYCQIAEARIAYAAHEFLKTRKIDPKT